MSTIFGIDEQRFVQIAEIASSAYNVGENTVSGCWSVLLGERDIGFDEDFLGGIFTGSYDNEYYYSPIGNFGQASAVTYQLGSTDLAIAFRGNSDDIPYFSRLVDTVDYRTIVGSYNALGQGSYLDYFSSYLSAVADYASGNGIANIWVTGHSLGAAAANSMRVPPALPGWQ